MRPISAAFFISLDGVVESPDKWHFPYFNDEMGNAIGSAMGDSDAMMMGRVNYEQWASFWPSQPIDDPFAAHINGVTKYAVSSTLDSVDWANTTLIKGDVAAQIAAIKQQPGKAIAISGSGTLVNWLMQNNLLDELKLMVHPIVVGQGKRLFPEGGPKQELKLVDAQSFSTGVQYLTYQVVKNEG